MNKWRYPFTVESAKALHALMLNPIPSGDAEITLKSYFWTYPLEVLVNVLGDVPDVRHWVVGELLDHIQHYLSQPNPAWEPEAIGVCQDLIDDVIKRLVVLESL